MKIKETTLLDQSELDIISEFVGYANISTKTIISNSDFNYFYKNFKLLIYIKSNKLCIWAVEFCDLALIKDLEEILLEEYLANPSCFKNLFDKLKNALR